MRIILLPFDRRSEIKNNVLRYFCHEGSSLCLLILVIKDNRCKNDTAHPFFERVVSNDLSSAYADEGTYS